MSSIDKINVGGVDFDITSSPTPVMAPVETGTTATRSYAIGEYVIVGSTLHEVTAAIAIGDTYTEGTNISTSTSLGDEIKQINNDLTKKALVNTYYDSNTKKLYQVNSDGTQGGEISMGNPNLDYANPIHKFADSLTFTANKDCYLIGCISRGSSDSSFTVSIDNEVVCGVTPASTTTFINLKIANGQSVSLSGGSVAQRTGLNIYQAL